MLPPTAVLERSDTRERIVMTAERLFRDIGYQKTTVADIARALKMSPANVYRFFDSKKAINEAVAARLMGEVEAALAAIAGRPGPASERLRAMIVALAAMNGERYTEDQRMHEMVQAALTESWEVVHAHLARIDAVLGKVIADGMASGAFAVRDVAATTRCLHVALIRFFHPRLMLECAHETNPTLEQMIEFVLRALEAPPAGDTHSGETPR